MNFPMLSGKGRLHERSLLNNERPEESGIVNNKFRNSYILNAACAWEKYLNLQLQLFTIHKQHIPIPDYLLISHVDK